MKLCHKEAMKLIKELENKKVIVLNAEQRLNTVSYKEGDVKPKYDYDYSATRKEVENLDAKIRKIKHELAKANCAVLVDDFNISIGEALVYLAQLSDEQSRLIDFANSNQLEKRITQTGVVICEERNFDVKKAANDLEELQKKINKLQVAIDRANLVNYIEI